MGAWHDYTDLLVAIFRTGLYKLFFLIFLYLFGFTVLMPRLPTLLTNFFASRSAGVPLACEDFSHDDAPEACQNAHAEVVDWTSWTSFLSNSIFAFMFAPWIGDLSDVYGRKPFILLGLNLNLLPIVVIILYLNNAMSLIWYFPANAITGISSAVSMYLAVVADVLEPKHRTAGFGMVVSSFSLAFMIGPLVGAFISTYAAIWTCLLSSCSCILFAVFFIPESLPNCTTVRDNPGPCFDNHMLVGFVKCYKIINKNRLFQKLAFCMAVSGIIAEGIQDLLVQYLQLTVDFTPQDQGLLFTIIGAGNLLVQSFILAWLAPLIGEQKLLMTGFGFSVVEQFCLAFIKTKGQAFAAVAIGSLAGVSWPAIAAIKSVNSSPAEQGMVQGALTGIRSLASGAGPLLFARIFSLSTRSDSPFGYHPGIVFYVSAGLSCLSFLVACSIPRNAGSGAYKYDSIEESLEDGGAEVDTAAAVVVEGPKPFNPLANTGTATFLPQAL